MRLPFLFDVRPGPEPVARVGGLILLAFVVLMFTAALIVGFVFLLKALKQGGDMGLRAKCRRLKFTRLMLGDVCLNFEGISPQSNALSHNNRSHKETPS